MAKTVRTKIKHTPDDKLSEWKKVSKSQNNSLSKSEGNNGTDESSPDRYNSLFIRHLIFATFLIIASRLFFTFLFALIYDREWRISLFMDSIPTIAFNADAQTFTKINSLSILASFILVVVVFLLVTLTSKRSDTKAIVDTWIIAIIMQVMQFFTSLYISRFTEFSTDSIIGWIIIPLAIACIIIYLLAVPLINHNYNVQD